ncbi:phytosulfokine receptor 1-like [Magnolia sinica]|uniref:phytosulfokine receptor 1-like n=1 Tax=Magnolia sinica TaxID=86752 RepID=UPI002659A1B5|nr:phytosulfokine receptor 1-like [Magnolia sinica]
MVALSTCEAEYVAASSTVCKAIWLKNILKELKHRQEECTVIYVDNKLAIELAKNSVQHGRSKHIDTSLLEMGFGDSFLFFIFMWFCFQCQVLKSQNVNCNSKDLIALEGFLNGLDSRIDGWAPNSSSVCCSWVGVYCNGSFGVLGRRVIGLDLGNKGLKGNVLKSLAGLDQLKFLNLSSNSLKGNVSSNLFRLKQLQVLDLSYNDFSSLIPTDTHLPSILVFNVSGNLFTGHHPLLVGSSNLLHFIISDNQFSGNTNPDICNSSTQIQVLQFSMNSFSGIFPAGFGNCSSLQEVSLDSNNLTGNLPDDLFRLSTLRQLFLQENGLSGQLSNRIGNLSNLVDLDLSKNLFFGSILDAFSKLKNLEFFLLIRIVSVAICLLPC